MERLEPANKKAISQQRYARADAILKIVLGESWPVQKVIVCI
jgi:hypothetical protein